MFLLNVKLPYNCNEYMAVYNNLYIIEFNKNNGTGDKKHTK